LAILTPFTSIKISWPSLTMVTFENCATIMPYSWFVSGSVPHLPQLGLAAGAQWPALNNRMHSPAQSPEWPLRGAGPPLAARLSRPVRASKAGTWRARGGSRRHSLAARDCVRRARRQETMADNIAGSTPINRAIQSSGNYHCQGNRVAGACDGGARGTACVPRQRPAVATADVLRSCPAFPAWSSVA
jgi:hypothetical protein